MRVCPKCSAYFADDSSPFCRIDGTPLVNVDPHSENWNEGTRRLEETAKGLRKLKRKLKWRRVLTSATTMTMATVVVCVVAVNAVIYLKPKPEPSVPPAKALTVEPTPKAIASPTPLPECTNADKGREREAIIAKFGPHWHRQIEDDRQKIIPRSVPGVVEKPAATVGSVEYQITFSKNCSASSVTVRYSWQVTTYPNGKKNVVTVPQEKKFTCLRNLDTWRCH